MIRTPVAVRVSIIILSCISPFVFPAAVTGFLAFSAALIFPPLAILLGMLMDLLYQPAGYWPVASCIGLLFCIIAVVVRSFVKTRIM